VSSTMPGSLWLLALVALLLQTELRSDTQTPRQTDRPTDRQAHTQRPSNRETDPERETRARATDGRTLPAGPVRETLSPGLASQR
jgi:hypothetical protein